MPDTWPGCWSSSLADQILVLQYERCRTDPGGELARTYGFLGLDPFVPGEIRREVNVSGAGKVEIDPMATDRLADLYRADALALAASVPSLDLSLWPWVAGVAVDGQAVDEGATS